MANPVYLRRADIGIETQLLVKLTNPNDKTATTVNLDVLKKKMLQAESVINGYLATRYTIPLTSDVQTDFVRYLAAAITEYYLWLSARKSVPEDIDRAYVDAKDMLEKIAKGWMTLGATTATEDDALTTSTTKIYRGSEAD